MWILEKALKSIQYTQEVPGAFGHLHLSSLIGVILISLVLCVFLRDAGDKTFRVIIGIMFCVMLAGELIKQFIEPLSMVDGVIVRSYSWGAFPFQLCSTPLYILPILALTPDSKIRDAAAAYTMTAALIGGIAVYATPFTVFSEYAFSNVQTMVHHGIQIVSGIYVACYYRRRLGLKFYLGGMAVFAVMLGIALYLDTAFYDMLLRTGRIEEGEMFNMFYISPRLGMISPFYEELLNSLGPAVYVPMYAAAILLLSAVIVIAAKRICKLMSGINFPTKHKKSADIKMER